MLKEEKNTFDFTTEMVSKKFPKASSIAEQFAGVYCFDIETRNQTVDGITSAVPYAVNLLKLNEKFESEKVIPLMKTCMKRFDGDNCVEKMVDFINSDNKKKKVQHKKTKKWVEAKRHIFLYAHNAGGFDSRVILASKNLKFSSKPIKAGGRLLRLTIETENCHINLQDTMAYLSGSLKKLCESFKLEKTSSKSEFLGHIICNAENYHLMQKGY